MTLASGFLIPHHIVARDVGAETVILNLDSGIYFGLDPVGARFWQLIAEGKTLAEIRDEMLEEYEVTPAQLENDLLELVNELLAKNLVTERAKYVES